MDSYGTKDLWEIPMGSARPPPNVGGVSKNVFEKSVAQMPFH